MRFGYLGKKSDFRSNTGCEAVDPYRSQDERVQSIPVSSLQLFWSVPDYPVAGRYHIKSCYKQCLMWTRQGTDGTGFTPKLIVWSNWYEAAPNRRLNPTYQSMARLCLIWNPLVWDDSSSYQRSCFEISGLKQAISEPLHLWTKPFLKRVISETCHLWNEPFSIKKRVCFNTPSLNIL